MNPANKPQLVLILLFLSNKSLPLEVGYDFTPIVDDDGPAVCQREVSLLDCQGVPVQPDVDIYSCSIKARVNIFTCNKAESWLSSARLLEEAQGTEQNPANRNKPATAFSWIIGSKDQHICHLLIAALGTARGCLGHNLKHSVSGCPVEVYP